LQENPFLSTSVRPFQHLNPEQDRSKDKTLKPRQQGRNQRKSNQLRQDKVIEPRKSDEMVLRLKADLRYVNQPLVD